MVTSNLYYPIQQSLHFVVLADFFDSFPELLSLFLCLEMNLFADVSPAIRRYNGNATKCRLR